jgi:membrane-bound lytic murein transglycosylase MltF
MVLIRTLKIPGIMSLIFLISTTFLFAGIEKFKDENGITHIVTTNKKLDPYKKTKRLKGYDYIPTYEGMVEMASYGGLIEKYAKLHGLDPQLVRAVIKVESNFKRFAKSKKNAIGLMQVLPSTAALYNINDVWDPEKNIKAGTQHLKRLIDRYNGDLKLALAAYNAGESAVDVYKGIPPYKETTNYVDKVIRYYEFYANKKYDSNIKSLHAPFSRKVRSHRINNILYITNVKR